MHCNHLCEKGCDIYGKHPAECRDFRCLWLNGGLSEDERPDKLGLIFSLQKYKNGAKAWVIFETKPDAIVAIGPDKINQLVDALPTKSDHVFIIPFGFVVEDNDYLQFGKFVIPHQET